MTPDTIPEDIYALLDDDNHHVVNEENVEWAGEVFKNILRTRLERRVVKTGEDVLRFSALGKPDRMMWYQANTPEDGEKMGGKQNFKFLYGDVLEILLLFLTKEAGHTVTHEQFQVEQDGVRGSMDAVIDDVPADCKSASPYSFQKFKSGAFKFDDPFGYIPQLSGYSHAIGNTEGAGFLVADKVHGDIAWAPIDSYDILGNPPGPKIAHQKEIIALPEPPPRCYPDVPEGKSGNMKLGLNCSYCNFRDKCWADANGGEGLKKYIYSRGPVWLTKVVREPRVDQEAA